jgi:hypothetical protein
MKTKGLIIIAFLFISTMYSQVGIGTVVPNPSALLDVFSGDKGILIPRVSLSNINVTQLDGVNNAATGLLIYNTNAAVIGGNGVGYYYFNGATWERLITAASVGDDDWHEVGTSNSPNDINDNIFTQGKVAIGTTTANYKLDILENTPGAITALNVDYSANTNAPSVMTITENGTGTGTHKGLFIDNSGSHDESIYGLNIAVSNTGSGAHYNIYNAINAVNSPQKYAIYNNFSGNGSGTQYGLYNNFQGNTIGNRTASFVHFAGTGIGGQTGHRVDFYSDNGNNFAYTTVFGGANNGTHIGLSVLSTNTGAGIKKGVDIDIDGDNGKVFAMNTDISGTGIDDVYAIKNVISRSGDGIHYGLYNELAGLGSGNKYGNYSFINSLAGGTHYGFYADVQKTGSYAAYLIGNLYMDTGRATFVTNNDASGTAGSGVLEIAGSLRLDDNEIITNTNSTLFLQHDNDGDLHVDNTTFVVDASANSVGVGTTSPGHRLDIVGRMRVRNNAQTSGIWYSDATNDRQFAGVNTHSSTGTSQKWGVWNNSAWRFVVQGNGRVGIGTTAPNYTLDVAGDINTSGNIRQSGGAYNFPDYVFESYFDGISTYKPDYRLMSLSETESFLIKYKHLPNVQSRVDVATKGWNVTEGVRTNLEKIEELYLHTIQLNKKNKALIKENKDLKKRLLRLEKIIFKEEK